MDGRAELERVILHYEKQRAEAIRAKQEAEIVLPFVRAALEELDSATGQAENAEVMERVQAQLESARPPQPAGQAAAQPAVPSAPVAQPAPAGQPAAPAFAAPQAPAFTPDPRASIASLIEEAEKEKAS